MRPANGQNTKIVNFINVSSTFLLRAGDRFRGGAILARRVVTASRSSARPAVYYTGMLCKNPFSLPGFTGPL